MSESKHTRSTMPHNGNTTIAALLSGILFLPVGILLGALGIREVERLEKDRALADRMADDFMVEDPAYDEPSPRYEPETRSFECDLCGATNEAPIEVPEVECVECGNLTHNPHF